MPTRQKARTIDQLSDQLTRANLVIVTVSRGLKVGDLQTLSGNLRTSGAEIHIAKNTLTRIAAGNAGVVGLDPLLEGPTALVFSFEDAVQTAKAVSDFVRTSRILSVKGGVMGDRTVTAAAARDAGLSDGPHPLGSIRSVALHGLPAQRSCRAAGACGSRRLAPSRG